MKKLNKILLGAKESNKEKIMLLLDNEIFSYLCNYDYSTFLKILE